jgi:hypothetical protein
MDRKTRRWQKVYKRDNRIKGKIRGYRSKIGFSTY